MYTVTEMDAFPNYKPVSYSLNLNVFFVLNTMLPTSGSFSIFLQDLQKYLNVLRLTEHVYKQIISTFFFLTIAVVPPNREKKLILQSKLDCIQRYIQLRIMQFD